MTDTTTAIAAAAAADPAAAQLRTEQFDLLNANAIRGLLGGFVGFPMIGLGLFWLDWPPAFIRWFALVSVLQCVMLVLEIRIARGARMSLDARARTSLLCAVVLGSVWGSAGVLFFHDDPRTLAALTITYLTLMSSTAMATAIVLPNVYAFNVPSALPFIVQGATQSSELGRLSAAAVAMMLVLLLIYAHSTHRTLVRSIRIGIDNRRLNEELTEQRVRERTQVLERSNQLKSEFLASMSHELRTPLNAIIGYSEMLHEDAQDRGDAALMADLTKIHGAGKLLLGLVNAVLDLSKIEAGKMELHVEQVELAALLKEVEDVCAPLVARQGNRLSVVLRTPSRQLCIDRAKIGQVLINLVGNAAKFTRDGQITITVDSESSDGRHWFSFGVADTGVGMSEAQLADLFQDFTQVDAEAARRVGGTGLGLALSRRLCRLAGGDITVTSEPGRGSCFVARIPEAALPPSRLRPLDAVAVDVPPPAALGDARDGPTVLVVDDDPVVRDLIGRYLAKDRCRVLHAPGGEAGLRMARELRPDVITLDVMMPDMDGWSVLAALKSDPALCDIPVIILSILDDRKTGYALGAADYLTKPVDRGRLSEALRRLRKGSRVLVVDDDEVLRLILCRILEADGYVVAQAGDGHEALDQMRLAVPAAVLLDLLMPGMDGFQFFAAMHAEPAWREIPVIVITAKELTDEDHARLNNSVTGILEKGGQHYDSLMVDVRSRVAGALGGDKGGR